MHRLSGIAFYLAATLAFGLMGALIKLVSAVYPTGQIVFMRSLFAILPVTAVLVARGDFPNGLKTGRPLHHLRRVGSGVLAMFCSFAALYFLPLPDATAIGFVMPLFSITLAAWLLKETIRSHRWIAVGVGFAGVAIIFAPYIAASFGDKSNLAALIGALLALAGAFLSALSAVAIRDLTRTEPPLAIVFYFSFGCTLIALATAVFGWIRPTPLDATIMIGIGLTGGAAQILMTKSYQLSDASLIAPFGYTQLIWAILFGWLFFADIPTLWMLAGTALLITSGLYVILHEHRRMRVLPPEDEMSKLVLKARS